MIQQNLIDQTIFDMRNALGDWHPKSVSSATHSDYFKTAKMLRKRNGKLADASCQRTYYKWRAAEAYFWRFELFMQLTALEIFRAGVYPDINQQKILEHVRLAQGTVDEVLAMPRKKGLEALSGQGEFAQLGGSRQKLRSHLAKRPLLGVLPIIWMELIWEKAKKSKYQNAVAVLALTGCRPAELVKGVKCELKDNQLSLTIIGAKTGVKKEFGQVERTLVFAVEGAEANHLAGICLNHADATHTIKLSKARLITDIMRKWSKKLWPRRTNNCLTPYVYRQAAFARFKKKWNAETVAIAMGQSSDRTQQKYGMKCQAGNGCIPVEVRGSTPVRHHESANSKGPKAPRKNKVAESGSIKNSDNSDSCEP